MALAAPAAQESSAGQPPDVAGSGLCTAIGWFAALQAQQGRGICAALPGRGVDWRGALGPGGAINSLEFVFVFLGGEKARSSAAAAVRANTLAA